MNGWDGLYTLLRWVLGGIFIHAGIAKLIDPQTFAILIEAYGMVPRPLLLPVAVTLPALEAAAGIGLLFDIRGSLPTVACLLGLFIAILVYGIRMGLDVDCGCFGPGDPEAEAFHGLRTALRRDLWMVAGVAYLYLWRRHLRIRPRALSLFTLHDGVSKRVEPGAPPWYVQRLKPARWRLSRRKGERGCASGRKS